MSDYMCPNCVTPWKCNGPHIPEAVSDRPIHEVLAEISAKVPPEEWAKLDKTHYADPDTLATLNRLERENAALRAELEGVRKDAERYRWLRDTQSEPYGDEFGVSFSYVMGFDDFKQPKRGLDTAIDSAMGDK